MTTNNALNIGLSGSTGSGSFAGSVTPTFISPILGQAVASSITFNPTSGGVIGTNTNDNVPSHFVGEFITVNVPTTIPVSVKNLIVNLTSISLTPGDWHVWGNVSANPAVDRFEVTSQLLAGAISTASTTLPIDNSNVHMYTFYYVNTSLVAGFNVPAIRLSLANTTTVYLVLANIGSSQLQINCSGNLSARRMR